MNGYIALYAGRRAEIYAETLRAAQQQAIEKLKVPRKGMGLLSVMLAERGASPDKAGEQVIHTPDL